MINRKSHISYGCVLESRLLYKAPSDSEYVSHIETQLAQSIASLEQLKQGNQTTQVRDAIAETIEKVNLYHDLLAPMRNSVCFDISKVYVPRCIGVLSHWPWHDLMKDWLCEVFKICGGSTTSGPDLGEKNHGISIPLERYLVQLLYETPLPPPGKLELEIPVGRMTFYCSRPPVNTISTLKNV